MITAVRAGTSVGVGVGCKLGLGSGVDAGAAVGLGRGVDAGAAVELLSDSGIGAKVGGASVAAVPQANTPITTAMNGEASIRGISPLPPIRPRSRIAAGRG